LIFETTSDSDVSSFGRQLLANNRDSARYFDTISQTIVETIFNEFKRADDSPLFALVRVYRLSRYAELPSELQKMVEPARERWMTLMGTYGIEPAWQHRGQSQGHKALNLGADQSPMISAAIYQLGLDVGIQLPKLDINVPVTKTGTVMRYFHIEDAEGSPYIPAQDTFVKPYGIRSVVGIGSGFLSDSAYVMLGFARATLDIEQGQKFAELAPYVSALLALCDERGIWQAA
jgi:hypothetical protein